MENELSKVYDPNEVEDKWYSFWQEKSYFSPDVAPSNTDPQADSQPTFSIVIPPPNVTGSLHMGHALNNTLQDILARKKRMQGYKVLWLPGTDHAGIATQNVVEKMLNSEGSSREEIGREAFLEKVWEWKAKYGVTITEQLKKLGSSCDWSRERFTMDEDYSLSVRQAFVQLFDSGHIYKDRYIINWCPRCTTALSDIEVEHEELNGNLWHFLYPIKGTGSYIKVATTRPETMLGDVAVAVNPSDERFKDLIGKTVTLPLVDREIPIIADHFVDKDFGSGAVKVTPGHDPNDFEIGRRHDLPKINIMTEQAILNNEVPEKYRGLDRFEARKFVIKDLDELGLLDKIEEHNHSVGHCYRCRTIIEPYLSLQWFLKMKDLSAPAIDAVKSKQITFHPEHWEKTYFDWMDKIRDWCISRQIWWGHQIPVWYCGKCSEYYAALEAPTQCRHCGSGDLTQDPDVLDTWFSSQLWPFATMGWPQDTADLKDFYPTSVLVTAHDIIFFWVSRMIMAGLYFQKEVPFTDVYIHTLIKDKHGKKMSKSFGNVIDPLTMIEKYGTDALRFTLTHLALPGRDIFLSEEKIEFNRNFANKIWNASRFVLMNLSDLETDAASEDGLDVREEDLTLFDKWMISILHQAIKQVSDDIDSYNFSKVARTLHDLIWSEFCDWFIEISKPRLYDEGDQKNRETAQRVLLYVLDNILRLLHPLMPFISEEIWQKLPRSGDSVMIASWPEYDESKINISADQEVELLKDVTVAIRRIRSFMGLATSKKLSVQIYSTEANMMELVVKNKESLCKLAFLDDVGILEEKAQVKGMAYAVEKGIEVFVPLAGLVDVAAEKARIEKELGKASKDLDITAGKLANENFISRAAPEIIVKEKERHLELSDKIAMIKRQLEVM